MPPKTQPVKSAHNLRQRVERLLIHTSKSTGNQDQRQLGLPFEANNDFELPTATIKSFLDFITDTLPDGDVYLFGGVLRDLALFGKKGFNSDIDMVVVGNWSHLVTHLLHLNAVKNKFGGYRLTLGGWPIDIWNAEDTWAIKQQIVPYKGISSLIDTTVLNWDAILMNWRTREFICRKNYFKDIDLRVLDIVLENNPNPLGMAVRVFRHLYLKDARKITPTAAKYMANCAKQHTFEEFQIAEKNSYNNNVIEQSLHSFFGHIDTSADKIISDEYSIASKIMEQKLSLALP